MNTSMLTILRKAVSLREELEQLDHQLLNLLTDTSSDKPAPKKIKSQKITKIVKKERKGKPSSKKKTHLIVSQKVSEQHFVKEEQASLVNLIPEITEISEPIFSADPIHIDLTTF